MHILTARVILEEEGPRPQIACGAWSAGALITNIEVSHYASINEL